MSSAGLQDMISEAPIGFVLSNANTTSIPFALFTGDPEVSVREENLAVVVDIHEGTPAILGVIREIKRLEPFLRQYQRVSIIDFPHAYESVEKLPYTNAKIIPLAEIESTEQGLRLNPTVTYVPFPGSKVHLVREGRFLTSLIRDLMGGGQEPLTIGEHKYTPGLEFPLDHRYLRYHVGVFGATGMGKSRLIKALVDEIVEKTEYAVIIFDHTGMDYAPFYPESTIYSTNVMLDALTAASWLAERLRASESLKQYIEGGILRLFSALQSEEESYTNFLRSAARALQDLTQRELDDEARAGVEEELFEAVKQIIRSTAQQMGAKYAQDTLAFRMDLMVTPSELASVLARSTSPEDVIELARVMKEQGRPLVIDLSLEDTIEAKRAIITSIIETVWRRVAATRGEQNIIFVVDEAQNYAYRAGYCQRAIEKVAREGRKWGIGLIISSQRLAGSVDPDIRANLNTIFFSRLNQTVDLSEISNFADIAGLSMQSLSQLGQREFYVAGLMNPLRKPVVIRVRNVPEPGGG